jgi:hypothetical protein
VERQKATLKIRQITRKSHTKLHIYRGELLNQSGIPVQTLASSGGFWRRRLQLTRQDPNFAREPERKEAKRLARRSVVHLNPSQHLEEEEKGETPGSPRTRDAAGE